MDGYVKNKKQALATVRKTILYKYAITFLIIIFIPVWLFALTASQPPEEWTHTEAVFSHISDELVGRYNSPVLNTQDGRQFVVEPKYIDVDDLVPGDTYHIVFSSTTSGFHYIKALSDGDSIFQNLDDSIKRWEHAQRELVIAIIVTLMIEAVALILVDRLWCKKEHFQIKKIKADIARREDRFKNR